MVEATLAAAGLLLLLTALRGVLAVRALAVTTRPASADELCDVTVLVPVRSGDPLLAGALAASVRTLAPARVALLVDDDDHAGTDAARRAADGAPHVVVVSFPPPPPGVNPKVHKLAAADVRTGVVVLLDDDTALPAGGLAGLVGALDHADLATGVPVYREQGGPWSRLLAAFVNGSALVTYLPLARLAPPVSVNGMVVALRTDALHTVGGFDALLDATCDDYALARLFRAHRLPIAQTAQHAVLATTVPSAAAYLRTMHRWLMFAGEVLRRDLSWRLGLVVLLPSVLPLVVLVLAVASGNALAVAVAAGTLAASALVTWALRRRVSRVAGGLLGVLLEPVAAVSAPVQAVAAQLGPRTVTWRGRRVLVGIGSAP